jgi:predicted MFS family arabinose efflux permease
MLERRNAVSSPPTRNVAAASLDVSTAPAGEASGGWPLVWALSLAQLVAWGSIYYGFSLFVVPMEAELGWSRISLNGALSLGLLMSGLFAYPVGSWIDRNGGRALMTIGSLTGAGLLVVWSQVESPMVFYAVWIGLGLSMAATLYEPAFAVLTRSFPHSYRTKITALTLVGGFASTVFIPLTQIFIDQLGWRHALIALALCNLVICVPIHALLLRDRQGSGGHPALPKEREREIAADALRRALRHPVFWALAVCFTAYYSTFSALTFHIIPLLTGRRFENSTIIAAIATIGPAQVAGRVVLLALGRRLTTRWVGRIVVLAFPLSVLFLIALPSSVPALFAFAVLYGGANGIMTILRGTAVPDLLWREGYGAINGALAFPSNVAKAVAPFAAALIWRAAGDYDAVLWTIVGGSMIAAAGFWFAAAVGRRPA